MYARSVGPNDFGLFSVGRGVHLPRIPALAVQEMAVITLAGMVFGILCFDFGTDHVWHAWLHTVTVVLGALLVTDISGFT